MLVTHALTGTSRVLDWWSGLAGPGKLLDTRALAIVGMVRAQREALADIGLRRFAAVVGGSLGGMQAIAWAFEAPAQIERVIAIGAYDHFAAMGIALNAVAREAIRIARTPAEGIALARKIAMLTYKSETLLDARYGRNPDRGGGDPTRNAADRYDVEGYLDHQGAIFSARMDPNAYLTLTRAMDLFDTRDAKVPHPFPHFTFAGISSDWLFLPRYVRAAAERFTRAGADSTYVELASDHGHDAFLAEPERLQALLAPRLARLYANLARTADQAASRS